MFFSKTRGTAEAIGLILSISGCAFSIEYEPISSAPASSYTTQVDVPARAKLFRDWSKPDAVIVFSGQQHGYLEPCGCSPQFQKGGLARRFGFIQSLQKEMWPVVMVDLGGLLDDHSQQHPEGKYIVGQEQSLAKLEIALEALQKMGFLVVNLAPEDINVPNGFDGLMGTLLNMNNPPQPRTLNANLGIDKDFIKEGLVLPHITRQVGSLKISFIGMVGETHKDRMSDPEFKDWQAPGDVIGATLEKLKQESDVRVLLLYGPQSEAKTLAEKFPELDVIIHAGDTEEPPDKPVWVDKTMLVTIGWKGKYTGAIGVFAKEKKRTRFELVSLDDRFPEDKSIRELLDLKYIEKLAALKLIESSPKVPFDPSKPELSYVGSQGCEQCHPTVFKKWSATRHATALKTLVEGHQEDNKHIAKGKEANPECVICHTTGFSHQTGYDGTPKTAQLGGNGCENCHGPASEHVKIYSNLTSNKDELARARKMVHAEPQAADHNLCSRCHDGENDPKFDFDERWADIEHGTEAGDDQKLWPAIREKLSSKK